MTILCSANILDSTANNNLFSGVIMQSGASLLLFLLCFERRKTREQELLCFPGAKVNGSRVS